MSDDPYIRPPTADLPEIPSHARPDLIIFMEGGRLLDPKPSLRSRLKALLARFRRRRQNPT